MHPVQKKRIEAGLSAQELAEQAKLSVVTIYRIEQDQRDRKVRYDTAAAVARALGCKVTNLFSPTELTDQGRPAHTGGKVTIVVTTTTRTEITFEGDICPNCWTQLSTTGNCICAA